MSDELRISGQTPYGDAYSLVLNAAGAVWNGAAFVAYAVADLDDYAVALTETPAASGRYAADFPAAITVGRYRVEVYEQAGASPAIGDVLLADGELFWTGTAEIDPAELTLCMMLSKVVKLGDQYTITDLAGVEHVLTGDDVTGPSSASIATAAAASLLVNPANKLLPDAAGGVTLTTLQAALLALSTAIKAKTDIIGSAQFTWAGPGVPRGDFVLYAGNDYLDADGTALPGTITGYAGPSLVGATAVLRLLDAETFDENGTAEAELEVEAAISVVGTTVSLKADITKEETAALSTSPPADPRNYVYQFWITTLGGSEFIGGQGRVTVKKGLTAPAEA